MRKLFLVGMFFCRLPVGSFLSAQSTNWADYGLSEEAVKFLSEKEKQAILNSRTPEQSHEYYEKGIKDGSIKPEGVPPPFLYLLGEQNNQTPTQLSEEVVSCFDYYTTTVPTGLTRTAGNCTCGG